jgi:hypothetical protein
MMQMFKYPQGEGGRQAPLECQPETLAGTIPFIYNFPLLSRFVTDVAIRKPR